MRIKGKLGLLILVCVVVVSALFWYIEKEPYSTESVVQSMWDKYEVQSFQIGETNRVISVDVYDKDDISEVEEYLKENLSKEDLMQYEIEVFSNKGKDY